MSKPKVMIVEDEETILQGLADIFTIKGYEVMTSRNGRDALENLAKYSFDLVLLDVMLPEVDGFTVCCEIRKRDRHQPIILLTAKSSEEDIVAGLSLGADDYVTKPFSVSELLLRVEAVLRRARKPIRTGGEISIGPLTLDTGKLVGWREKGREIEFTRKEVEILLYLIEQNGRPVPREELLAEVWGYNNTGEIETRTVDIHIGKLRKKIEEDAKNPEVLLTVRGEGYKLLSVQ